MERDSYLEVRYSNSKTKNKQRDLSHNNNRNTLMRPVPSADNDPNFFGS